MSKCPINKDILDCMLRGEFPEDADLIINHLQGYCPDCESFFSELSDEYEELFVKFKLAQKDREQPGPSLSSKEKQDMLESIENLLPNAESRDPSPAIITNRRLGTGRIMALAAGIILVIGLSFLLTRQDQHPSDPMLKGGPEEFRGEIYLQFLVVADRDGKENASSIIRGINRGSYPEHSRLLFRYRLDKPGYVYIIRVDEGGAAEVIFPDNEKPHLKEAGYHDANAGDRLLAYPLKGLSGLQTFCAVSYSSERPRPDLETMINLVKEEIEINKKQNYLSRLRREWMDCFQIKVER